MESVLRTELKAYFFSSRGAVVVRLLDIEDLAGERMDPRKNPSAILFGFRVKHVDARACDSGPAMCVTQLGRRPQVGLGLQEQTVQKTNRIGIVVVRNTSSPKSRCRHPAPDRLHTVVAAVSWLLRWRAPRTLMYIPCAMLRIPGVVRSKRWNNKNNIIDTAVKSTTAFSDSYSNYGYSV